MHFSLKLGIFNIIFLFSFLRLKICPTSRHGKAKVIRGHFRSRGVHAPKAEK
jgi:hypothetical protein